MAALPGCLLWAKGQCNLWREGKGEPSHFAAAVPSAAGEKLSPTVRGCISSCLRP
ncbi:hypothetical protein HMPREF0262_01664 [Clostridium sp. ATCC 29733]|nr:hypothetical protein HMPREF0262_01664 [Clostridium sp. ATCC 29733]